MERAEKYATAEDISGIKGKNEEAQFAEPKRPWYNRLSKGKAKAPEKDDRANVGQSDRKTRMPRSKFDKYTPLKFPIDQMFEKAKVAQLLKWPGPMRSPPEQRDPKKRCEFHRDHGHETKNCRSLKDQI
ncbi:hypothetical protein ACOSQ2_010579 [Xanthoceras sorbifolium]